MTEVARRRRVFGIGVTATLISGLLILGALVLGWDLSRNPSDQWSAAVLLRSIDVYQHVGSPVLEHAGVRCRFQPTCSHYAEEVIAKRGTLVGVWKASVRVARCGPWTPDGTLDPP